MARITFLRCALLCFLGLATPLHAQKNEAGLISAWEQEQKADPSTVKFEKLGERKYHFSTRRFPFDGELLIRNVSIQDFGEDADLGMTSGTVEIELQGISEDFQRTFAMSYGQWALRNTLYWDTKVQRWLTQEQHLTQFRERSRLGRPLWSMLFSWGWLVIFLVILVALLFPLFRYNRRWKEITERNNRSLALTERAIQLSERNVQLQEEHTKLLQEIRDLLKT